MKETGLN